VKKILLILVLFVLTLSLSACNKGVSFYLLGSTELNLTTNDEYVEPGFVAKYNNKDISNEVDITNLINNTVSGDYTITYTLHYNDYNETLTRKVYYREAGCTHIQNTNKTVCETYWTSYLHTSVKLSIYYNNDEYHDKVHDIFNHVEMILSDYHKLSTKYDDFGMNNIYAINQNPEQTFILDPRLFDMISFSLEHQKDVNNLFNIALGPVISIWHTYRENCNTTMTECKIPSQSELEQAAQYTNPNNIILDYTTKSITMSQHMSLDLGGMSKGYISKQIIDYLNSFNFSYLLNNGTSNISIGGTHPTRENGKFLLAITTPGSNSDWYAEVYLGGGDQLVTSGDYQQYYEVDGQLYHHIINPITLFPERYSRSVSIITDDPALADLYSTAIFTMPIDEGLDFVNRLDNVEAIWYTLDNKAIMSDHFQEKYLKEIYIPIDH
jgi:thiamine biosynthesis lipoprotein